MSTISGAGFRPFISTTSTPRRSCCSDLRRRSTRSWPLLRLRFERATMAQLSDDCFAFGGPMMSVDEAVAIIASRVRPIAETERVGLVEADGRILAGDVAAPLPLPPFMNSAVDGYAVAAGELPEGNERAVPIGGRIQAGAAAIAPRSGH